jgi:hypothetical protein
MLRLTAIEPIRRRVTFHEHAASGRESKCLESNDRWSRNKQTGLRRRDSTHYAYYASELQSREVWSGTSLGNKQTSIASSTYQPMDTDTYGLWICVRYTAVVICQKSIFIQRGSCWLFGNWDLHEADYPRTWYMFTCVWCICICESDWAREWDIWSIIQRNVTVLAKYCYLPRDTFVVSRSSLPCVCLRH